MYPRKHLQLPRHTDELEPPNALLFQMYVDPGPLLRTGMISHLDGCVSGPEKGPCHVLALNQSCNPTSTALELTSQGSNSIHRGAAERPGNKGESTDTDFTENLLK